MIKKLPPRQHPFGRKVRLRIADDLDRDLDGSYGTLCRKHRFGQTFSWGDVGVILEDGTQVNVSKHEYLVVL